MTELPANPRHTHRHPGDAQMPGWRLAAAGLSASLVGLGLPGRSTLDWP